MEINGEQERAMESRRAQERAKSKTEHGRVMVEQCGGFERTSRRILDEIADCGPSNGVRSPDERIGKEDIIGGGGASPSPSSSPYSSCGFPSAWAIVKTG